MTIRLIVLDIDGVLTDGETKALDLGFLGKLAALNQLARNDQRRLQRPYPQITLCTGRPAPYAEALLQAIDGRLPAVFENGAGLYVPNGYRFLSHPELGNGKQMRAVRSRLEETLVQGQIAFLQPGKEYSLSIFAHNPEKTDELLKQTVSALGSLTEAVDLVYSASCLNVLPRDIHKGKGLDFLAEQIGINQEEMLGIGDSDIDLPFLARVGISAAPANANAAVKRLVDYVSPSPTSEGVNDILNHFQIPGFNS